MSDRVAYPVTVGTDIHSKLASIAGRVGPLNKTERNAQQGFNFRSIEALTGAVRPLFSAEGISIAPKLLSRESELVESGKGSKGYRTVVEMEYTFTAGSDGSSIVVSMPGEAVDYGDKSTSKAVQMAFKYALTEVLLVGSGDGDPDSHSPEVGRSGGRSRPRQTKNPDPAEASPSGSAGEPVSEPVDSPEALQASVMRAWVKNAKTSLVAAYRDDKELARKKYEEILRGLKLDPTMVPAYSHKDNLDQELDVALASIELESAGVTPPA